jgi:hypothetical protein
MPTFPVVRARAAALARWLVALSMVLAAGAALLASSPQFFEAATQADFLKGDVTDLSIDAQGRLELGFATEVVYETSSPFIWSMIPGAGDAIFLGSGNDGHVFRVDANSKSTRSRRVRTAACS